ncbi:DNA repair protein RecO [bacterium]|nr:DNA repair protein RecO [bacterium]
MRFLSTNAVVLRTINQGEADRIVTLFTEAQGKLSAIAKGARKPQNSLAPLTQVFAYSRVLLVKGKNLYILTQGKLKYNFPAFIQDIERFASASALVEIVDRMTEEGAPDKFIFDYLLAHLYVMEKAREPELILRSWELKLLSHLGYKPHLENCIICGKELGNEMFTFSPSGGGIICRTCAALSEDSLPITEQCIRTMQRLLATPVHRLAGDSLAPQVREELRSIVPLYVDMRAGKRGKTSEFIKGMEASGDVGFNPR